VVQGNLEAKNRALVASRIEGTIERIFVDEGDAVQADKTPLFQIDALKLRKAVEIRKYELAVARCALREKEASLERTKVQLEKAQIDFERSKKLLKRDAVTEDEFERYETQLKEVQALVKHGQSLIDLSAEQLRQAGASVVMAEKDMHDALVVAPISGRVSQRFQEPGEMAKVGDSVLRIDDLSLIEVSAFLPAQYYPRVVPGKLKMRVRVDAINLGEQTITYRSPTIDPKLRTFEIKCELKNPPDGVAPGGMANIEVLLQRRQALGVPTAAVTMRRDHDVVFTIKNDAARMVDVTPGLETDGWTELQSEGLAEGAPVVTMGQFLLNDGTPVAVQKDER